MNSLSARERTDIQMEMLRIASKPPVGLAFEIADLILLQGWAEFHNVRMVVELDNCLQDEVYEEVVAFYDADCSLRRWNLWRSTRGIVVQPLYRRTCHFGSVSDALDNLLRAQPACRKHSSPLPKAKGRPRSSTSQSATPCRA
ncbi:MAG TPA: hypothetical protein VNW90_02850 [Acetobacteraceae bacterium]|nr:hypothetical protein [Acetobacteraceae bacterium]